MDMTTTSLADAKNRLSEIVAATEATHERTIVTKNGRPVVAIIAVEDLEGLEETLDILGDPEALASLRESDITGKYGFFYDESEIRDMMARRVGGNPMTDDEIEDRVRQRMGAAEYDAARAAIREELLRDPDANVRERARDWV